MAVDNVVTPEDYGATDTTGAVDESTALQAALDDVEDTRLILDLNGRTWRHSSQLVVKDRTIVRNGTFSCDYSGGSDQIVCQPDSGTYAEPIFENVTFSRLQYQSKTAVVVSRGRFARFRDCKWDNWINTGNTPLRIEGTQGAKFDGCVFDGAGSYMVRLHRYSGGNPCTDIQFIGCAFTDTREDGTACIYSPSDVDDLYGAASITFLMCEFGNLDGPAIVADAPRRFRFLACRFEGILAGQKFAVMTNTLADPQATCNIFDQACTFDNEGSATPMLDFTGLRKTSVRSCQFPSTAVPVVESNCVGTTFHGNNYLADRNLGKALAWFSTGKP